MSQSSYKSFRSKYKLFRMVSQQKIMKTLRSIPGRKDLIFDRSLIKLLENILGTSMLRTSGVNKFYKLQDDNQVTLTNTQVYIIPADFTCAKMVCDHINAYVSAKNLTKFYILVIPRVFDFIIRLLEEEGLYECVCIIPLRLEFITIDTDEALSLELPEFYKKLFVEGNQYLYSTIAKSIQSSCLIFGNPGTFISLGEHSNKIYKMLNRSVFTNQSDVIDCMILFDRNIDYISTLLMPNTFASMLDEIFKINSNFVNINEKLKVRLDNETDETYSNIKFKQFSEAVSFLKMESQKIQLEYGRSQNMNIREMKRYLKNELKSVDTLKRSLATHIAASESIVEQLGSTFQMYQNIEKDILMERNTNNVVDFIENHLTARDEKHASLIRLMCLLTIVQGSLTKDDFERLKLMCAASLGYSKSNLFFKLKKAGLLKESQASALDILSSKGNLSSITVMDIQKKISVVSNKKFPNLQASPVKKNAISSLNLKDDIFKKLSYVYDGKYIPLTCWLVYMLISQGPSFLKNIEKSLPENTEINIAENQPLKILRKFFVYFVGGISYAEIATFRILEEITGCKIILAGTNTVNGNDIVNACM